MAGPYTTFEAEDPGSASKQNEQVVSLAAKAEDPSGASHQTEQIVSFSPLDGFLGIPVPQTGQTYPIGTA